MKKLGFVLALMPILLAAAPAPAGNDNRGCGLPSVRDPEIRASFDRFDRGQSAGAAMICGMFLNTLGTTFPVH
jgi:hypothetical protein